MKRISLLSVVILLSVNSFAQNKSISIGLETDPIAFALKGYSIHSIIQGRSNWSFDAGLFGLRVPEGYSGNKGFITQMNGVGVKAHYHFKNNTKGLYIGIGAGFANEKATHIASSVEKKTGVWSAGPHIGYRIFLLKGNSGKGLYFTPWVSIDYRFPGKSISFESIPYKTHYVTFFPTLHIGYKF